MAFPKRKPNRLPYYDYSTPGAYFITVCTENRKPILSEIVGGGAFDAPCKCCDTAFRIYFETVLPSGCRQRDFSEILP